MFSQSDVLPEAVLPSATNLNIKVLIWRPALCRIAALHNLKIDLPARSWKYWKLLEFWCEKSYFWGVHFVTKFKRAPVGNQ